MALRPPSRHLRRLAAGAAVLALALPLSACGDDADASSDAPPQPVAEIAAVYTLRALGFVAAPPRCLAPSTPSVNCRYSSFAR